LARILLRNRVVSAQQVVLAAAAAHGPNEPAGDAEALGSAVHFYAESGQLPSLESKPMLVCSYLPSATEISAATGCLGD
jgi:hypothetical protein